MTSFVKDMGKDGGTIDMSGMDMGGVTESIGEVFGGGDAGGGLVKEGGMSGGGGSGGSSY